MCVANETASLLIRKSLEVKNRSNTLQAALSISNVEQAAATMKDENNSNPLGDFHRNTKNLTLFDLIKF